MDAPKIKLSKPNILGLLIAASLGVVVAIFIYQAQNRGWIARTVVTPKLPSLETRTILSEENTTISAIEKASLSVVTVFGMATGSGFLAAENLIVTNKHFVNEEKNYTVSMKDGQKYQVLKIYKDPNLDLAILQISANDLKPLDLADSTKIKIGQSVISMGEFVSAGIVSAFSENNYIKTDAIIDMANSGGPLINSLGQAVGVNLFITDGDPGISFAIPINSVKKVISKFLAESSGLKPYLGISYKFISQGAYIQDVTEDSPAKKAGIKVGDVLTNINGELIDTENKVTEIIAKVNIGEKLDLLVWRNGREIKLTVIVSQNSLQ